MSVHRLSYGGTNPEPDTRARGSRTSTDKRYRTSRWLKTRAMVLRRDGYRCRIVDGCEVRADTCDHVNPVYPGMPDAEFYDTSYLRAACGPHNLWRGLALRAEQRATPRTIVAQRGSTGRTTQRDGVEKGRSFRGSDSPRLRQRSLSPHTRDDGAGGVTRTDYTRSVAPGGAGEGVDGR